MQQASAPRLCLPRRFHWVWLGTRPIPEEHRDWIDGWRRLHPGWTATVWTDATLPELRNQREFDEADSYSKKSDFARYELLFRFGGVYLDTDVECLRNIEPLLDQVTAFAGEEYPGLIGSAILGSEPGHPWVEAVVTGMPGSVAEHFLTMEQTGPAYLTRVTAPRSDVKIFAPDVFYPVRSTGDTTSRDFGPETFAVHRFAKSWAAIEADRICSAARRVLEPLIRPGDEFVLEASGLTVDLPGRSPIPFVERGGADWGPPEDGPSAVQEVVRHRDRGVAWFVFLAPSFWWLSFYGELSDALRSTAVEVVDHPAVVAFRLR